MPAPLFTAFHQRAAGVLLHPTSLPSRQGIGSLGAAARAFVDFIAASGLGWWQVCPLNPTGYGDSPYQSFSSFAGNPYLIDIEALLDAHLLDEATVAPLRQLSPQHTEFGYLWQHFHHALNQAWKTAEKTPALLEPIGDIEAFKKNNAPWLDDYALFTALKKHHAGAPWNEWPTAARDHTQARKTQWPQTVADDARATIFQQFLFATQWANLRAYAAARAVRIFGDIPVFAALDSADVWAAPQFFQLDPATSRPLRVAGVPPDYFAPNGQLWGNPLYDWPTLKKDNYRWWTRRLTAAFNFFDAVRIDHFRGFHDYWSIPANAPDARNGDWQPGPGLDLFHAIRHTLGNAPLVAEDLGELTPGVHTLRKAAGLPGMAVLQFAFGGDATNLHLPHNHAPDTIVYPGTHDNDTTLGWYSTAPEPQRDFFRRYLGSTGAAPHWDLIRTAFTSPAALAIVPLQDILGKGSEARFNTPGTPSGNWTWRFTWDELAHARTYHAPNLHRLATITGRLANPAIIAAA
jgi:4-alpha-glucanotransferase